MFERAKLKAFESKVHFINFIVPSQLSCFQAHQAAAYITCSLLWAAAVYGFFAPKVFNPSVNVALVFGGFEVLHYHNHFQYIFLLTLPSVDHANRTHLIRR